VQGVKGGGAFTQGGADELGDVDSGVTGADGVEPAVGVGVGEVFAEVGRDAVAVGHGAASSVRNSCCEAEGIRLIQ
jgi:hypothetical protein